VSRLDPRRKGMARAWAAWAGVAALRRAVIARLRDAARMLRPKGLGVGVGVGVGVRVRVGVGVGVGVGLTLTQILPLPLTRPKGRALRAWQQNAHEACGACEAQLLVEP